MYTIIYMYEKNVYMYICFNLKENIQHTIVFCLIIYKSWN